MKSLYKCIVLIGIGSFITMSIFYWVMAPISYYISLFFDIDEANTQYLFSIIFTVIILYFLAHYLTKEIRKKWLYFTALLVGFYFTILSDIACYEIGSLLCDTGPQAVSLLVQYILFVLFPATILYWIGKLIIYLTLKITK